MFQVIVVVPPLLDTLAPETTAGTNKPEVGTPGSAAPTPKVLPLPLLLTLTRTPLEQLFAVFDSPDTVSTQAP